ncbi:MAG: hypothetical protein GYB49_17515 [Alphaproteobacteria bacterium]|nr:hypothetical protein [Alphaproteobacteria bacterium]
MRCLHLETGFEFGLACPAAPKAGLAATIRVSRYFLSSLEEPCAAGAVALRLK